MTTPSDPNRQPGPPDGGQWQQPQWSAPPPPGQPQYGQPQPPQYGQPQYGQPQYGQPQPPQYGQPQYGQPQPPQYGQPQYGQPQYGQPQYGQPQYGQPYPLTPPAKPKGRGKAVALAAAAVVVIGGGVTTYVAVSSSSDAGGSSSPTAAVQKLVTDLNHSDLVGLLDDLPPGERDAISTPFQKAVGQLKKNDVIRPDADLSKVGGVTVNATGLTFAAKTISINDNVQIVQLTGGKIALSGDAAKAPFTSDFLQAVAPGGLSANTNGSQTLDIGSVVRSSGKPIRIAVQRSGGKWFPSLLYTIADNATTDSGLSAPPASARIPAVGGSSADDAVKSVVSALLDADVERVAELLSPDELAVVHDYGKLITDRFHYSPTHVQLKDIEFADSSSGSTTRVTLTSLDMVNSDGSELKIVIDGSCATVTIDRQTKRLCSADLVKEFGNEGPFGRPLTAAQRTALGDLLAGITTTVGLDVSQTDGKWYINPIRSYFDLANALLSGLEGGDAKALLSLFSH
jgi:hypothetical protein